MHVYRLLLRKSDQAIEYATLIELHHPDYLGVSDLLNLYSIDASRSLQPQQLEAMRLLGLNAA